jgi:hypothetical protein
MNWRGGRGVIGRVRRLRSVVVFNTALEQLAKLSQLFFPVLPLLFCGAFVLFQSRF